MKARILVLFVVLNIFNSAIAQDLVLDEPRFAPEKIFLEAKLHNKGDATEVSRPSRFVLEGWTGKEWEEVANRDLRDNESLDPIFHFYPGSESMIMVRLDRYYPKGEIPAKEKVRIRVEILDPETQKPKIRIASPAFNPRS